MILKSVIDFIKGLVDLVARLLASALVFLGLWIPALFSVLYLAFCLATKTPLAKAASFYFAGLVLCCALAAVFKMYTATKRKNEKRRYVGGGFSLRGDNYNSFQPPKQGFFDIESARDDEQPMVFASRSDPNLFVYEFSDRLQFYVRRGDSVELVETKYKDK